MHPTLSLFIKVPVVLAPCDLHLYNHHIFQWSFIERVARIPPLNRGQFLSGIHIIGKHWEGAVDGWGAVPVPLAPIRHPPGAAEGQLTSFVVDFGLRDTPTVTRSLSRRRLARELH